MWKEHNNAGPVKSFYTYTTKGLVHHIYSIESSNEVITHLLAIFILFKNCLLSVFWHGTVLEVSYAAENCF